MDRRELLERVMERYGTEPEFVFDSSPDSFVLRHPHNGKWYAVVLSVERSRLGLPGDGRTDVLNVKLGPLLTGSFRGRPGVLPAYHMNKTHWVSLLLDGSAGEEDVLSGLDVSWELTHGTGKRRR